MCATTHGGGGVVAFIADDEAAAQAALEGAGIQHLIRPAVTVTMANLPGTGAATFPKVADIGVNVDLLLPVRISDDEFYAVLCADDPAAPRAPWRPGRQPVRHRLATVASALAHKWTISAWPTV